jgi:hypothetical protein
VGLLKVVRPLKIYLRTKCHGPTLSGVSFASLQKFERPPFWSGCSHNIKIMTSRSPSAA